MAKRKSKYMPFEEAREIARWHNLGSRNGFYDWHDRTKPDQIPKYPYRVYRDEWTSWTDFLGTDNKFKQNNVSYRPYEQAVAFVHTLGLRNTEEWYEFAKHSDRLPKDIPIYPYNIYRKNGWVSWNHWLGNQPKARIEEQKKIQNVRIAYLVTTEENGTFRYGTLPSVADLINRIKSSEGQVRALGCWKDVPVGEHQIRVVDVLRHFGTETWEGSKEFRFWNVFEVLEELNTIFEDGRT